MNIILYKVNNYTRQKELTPIEFSIDGKLICYIQIPEENPNEGFYEERFYNYEYDNSYETKFKKLKLNHRFEIIEAHKLDEANIANLVGYVHLNYFKKIKLNWIFRKTWIQNNENIKWLIGLICSFLFGYFTAKLNP